MNRHEYNKQILSIIELCIDKYPYLRFIQILDNLSIIDNTDRFYEESNVTWERLLSNEIVKDIISENDII